MTEKKPACRNCYFRRDNECHEKPPVVVAGSTLGKWPVVSETEWCGSYQRQVGEAWRAGRDA